MRKKEILLIVGFLFAAGILFAANAVIPKQSGRERIEALLKTQEPEKTIVPASSTAAGLEGLNTTNDMPSDSETTPAAIRLERDNAIEDTPKESPASVLGPVQAGPVGPQIAKSQDKVQGYVIITLNGRQYGDPIPMDRDKIITVKQDEAKINRIHITPDSVEMESSTCENQDCVGEGIITLENYKTRILSTYIICLPNGVQVEMVPMDGE